MLERISNISLEVDFNRSKRGKYSRFKSGLYDNSSFDINDSISFSPASKYLSKAGWLLKEFHQTIDEKVIVEFIYSGFYFEVSLNLQSINSLETVAYAIRKDSLTNLEDNPVIASLKVAIGGSNSLMPVHKELRGLDQLFQRFSSLNLQSELNIYNYELINTLLEGIYTLLQSDFEYLNTVLLNFLEKQTNKKLVFLLSKAKETTELNLLKIKPYNTI